MKIYFNQKFTFSMVKINVQQYLQKIKNLDTDLSLNNVDMETSKYHTFCYAACAMFEP